MSYNDDHYRKDEGGDFSSAAEAQRALDNGDLEELSNGNLYDRQTGEEYYRNGEKKN